MPREVCLAHLGTHMAVEIGDTITGPGLPAGVVGELSDEEIALVYRDGTLRAKPASFGVVWMDSVYLKERPDEAVHHS